MTLSCSPTCLAYKEPKAFDQQFIVNSHGLLWQKELETKSQKYMSFCDNIFYNYFSFLSCFLIYTHTRKSVSVWIKLNWIKFKYDLVSLISDVFKNKNGIQIQWFKTASQVHMPTSSWNKKKLHIDNMIRTEGKMSHVVFFTAIFTVWMPFNTHSPSTNWAFASWGVGLSCWKWNHGPLFNDHIDSWFWYCSPWLPNSSSDVASSV